MEKKYAGISKDGYQTDRRKAAYCAAAVTENAKNNINEVVDCASAVTAQTCCFD